MDKLLRAIGLVLVVVVAVSFIPGSQADPEHQHDPPWVDRYTFDYSGYSSSFLDSAIESMLENLQGEQPSYFVFTNENAPADGAKAWLPDDAIFHWHHHGSPTLLRFRRVDGLLSWIRSSDWSRLEDIEDALLIVLTGCQTGNDAGGQENHVDEVIAAGADCCVGFRGATTAFYSVYWDYYFFYALTQLQASVIDSADWAVSMVEFFYTSDWGLRSRVVKGKSSLEIAPARYGYEGGGGK